MNDITELLSAIQTISGLTQKENYYNLTEENVKDLLEVRTGLIKQLKGEI